MTIRYSNPDSPYQIRFLKPDRRPEILKQAQRFAAQEQSRPPEQQTPLTPQITDLLAQLEAAYAENRAANQQRAATSVKQEQLNKQAIIIINKMWKSVTGKYEDDPSEATHWGFKIKPRTRNVLRPSSLEDRLAVLEAYIAKEESRPEAERFGVPELAQVIELRDTLATTTTTSQAGQNQQENSFEAIKRMTNRMANYLQAAGIHLIAVAFDFDLSTQLQNWGYAITLKRKAAGPKESAAETETEADPAGDEAPAEASASTNGAADLDTETEVVFAVNK